MANSTQTLQLLHASHTAGHGRPGRATDVYLLGAEPKVSKAGIHSTQNSVKIRVRSLSDLSPVFVSILLPEYRGANSDYSRMEWRNRVFGLLPYGAFPQCSTD